MCSAYSRRLITKVESSGIAFERMLSFFATRVFFYHYFPWVHLNHEGISISKIGNFFRQYLHNGVVMGLHRRRARIINVATVPDIFPHYRHLHQPKGFRHAMDPFTGYFVVGAENCKFSRRDIQIYSSIVSFFNMRDSRFFKKGLLQSDRVVQL